MIALNAKLKFIDHSLSDWDDVRTGFRAIRFKGFDEAMTKISGYNGLKMEGEIRWGQFRRIEICRRRVDVDD